MTNRAKWNKWNCKVHTLFAYSEFSGNHLTTTENNGMIWKHESHSQSNKNHLWCQVYNHMFFVDNHCYMHIQPQLTCLIQT